MAGRGAPCEPVPASKFGLPAPNGRTSEWGDVRARGPEGWAKVPAGSKPPKGSRPHWGVDYQSRDAHGDVRELDFTAGYAGRVWAMKGSDWNTINLKLANGVVLQYLHASWVNTTVVPFGTEKDAKPVQPDTVLGRTGKTSPAADPVKDIHLHVQARWKGALIHPDCVLNPKKSPVHKVQPKKDPLTASEHVALRSGSALQTLLLMLTILVGSAVAANWFINSGSGLETRNCLKRNFGDQVPTCNDVAGGDGTLKRTTLNGVDLGPCRYVSNSGCLER